MDFLDLDLHTFIFLFLVCEKIVCVCGVHVCVCDVYVCLFRGRERVCMYVHVYICVCMWCTCIHVCVVCVCICMCVRGEHILFSGSRHAHREGVVLCVRNAE